jgi:hypothetical protein
MRDLVCVLQRLAPSVLLGLESLDALTCSEWARDADTPTRTLKVSLALPQHDAARRGGLVRDGHLTLILALTLSLTLKP